MSASPEILIVEDDHALNQELSKLVRANGYSVTQCYNGEDAIHLAVDTQFSIILLDVMLPDRDGLSVLQIIRSCLTTPVIIVSARHAEEERIRGLSAGADDYLAKPFNSEELLLRIDAILRRTQGALQSRIETASIDGLTTDLREQTAYIHGESLSVTPIELALLSVLMQNAGQVLSKAFLYQSVLNKRFSQYDRSLDMHLSRVRKKLHKAGWEGARLQTVHGKGYCLK